MPDRRACRLTYCLVLAGLIPFLGQIHAAEPSHAVRPASFQAIPSALPAVLDEERRPGERGLAEMSAQAQQAALRARRAHFERLGVMERDWGALDPVDELSPVAESKVPSDPGLAAYLRDAGLTSIGGTEDEPTGAVSLPVDPALSCPGFYVVRTHAGRDSSAGRFGVELLLRGAGSRTLQGGLNFGGRASGNVSGFAAFNIANRANEDQVVNIGLDAAEAGRLVLERRSGGTATVIIDQAVGAGDTAVSATVPPGFYVASYRPAVDGDVRYSMSALTSYVGRPGGGFQGGVVFGGFHDPNRSTAGFGGFCIADAYDVEVKVLSRPSYGSSGARGMAFSLSSGDGTVFLDSRPPLVQTFQDCDECPPMAVIPAGSFVQGSPQDEPQFIGSEYPRREVEVPEFAMGQTAVTFAQWDACVADGGCTHNPDDEGWGRGTRPVINISWHDARQYASWLSSKTGRSYRLPSESEWEFAARAGTTGRFNTGDCIGPDQANFQGGAPAAHCPGGEFREQTVPVASFSPNQWGLYDMHGNVWEWVADCWNWGYWGNPPADGSAWLSGSCDAAPLRGGSWAMAGRALRSGTRAHDQKSVRTRFRGFRVAADIDDAGLDRIAMAKAPPAEPDQSTVFEDDQLWQRGRIIGPGVLLDERGNVLEDSMPADALSGIGPMPLLDERKPPAIQSARLQAAVSTGRFVSSSGRALSYRIAIPPGIDPAQPQPVLINFHGNNTGTQRQMLDSFFPSTAWEAEQRGLIPITVSSPETRLPPQEETRQWMAEDRQLLHEFLQYGLGEHLAVDHHQVFFDGGSQGACFLHDFMQSHGEHYGGGFYGGCGCYNSPDPTWDPPQAFRERMKVYIHNTTDDFLFEHGKRGYAYYKYTIGLTTRGDLDQPGAHCTLNWEQRRVALDWFTGAIELPEPPSGPHWSRLSSRPAITGLALGPNQQILKLVAQTEPQRALLYRWTSASSSWDRVGEFSGRPRQFVGNDENLFAVLNERLYRGSYDELSSMTLVPDLPPSFQVALDGDGVVYQGGQGLRWSATNGQDWQDLGNFGIFPSLNLSTRSPGHDAIFNIQNARIAAMSSLDGSWRPYLAAADRQEMILLQHTPAGPIHGVSWDGASVWATARTGSTLRVFRSADEGQTWQEVPLSGPMANYGWYMQVTALGPGRVLIHGAGESAWLSEDGGQNWTRVLGLETAFNGTVTADGETTVFTAGNAAFRMNPAGQP